MYIKVKRFGGPHSKFYEEKNNDLLHQYMHSMEQLSWNPIQRVSQQVIASPTTSLFHGTDYQKMTG